MHPKFIRQNLAQEYAVFSVFLKSANKVTERSVLGENGGAM